MSREPRFLSRVRAALPTLGPAERKLGELVADFPGELASYNASELALLASVSNATVTRFVRRLGYASYEEARVDARRERVSGSRLYADTDTPDVTDVSGHALRDGENIRDTLARIDLPAIDGLTEKLLSARKVWVIGFRASAAFASYMQWQLTQVIENIVAIPGPGQTMGEHIASVQQGDLVILFALRRRVAQTDLLIERIAASKAAFALISDESMQIEPRADWHLHCETRSSGPLFSHAAVMSLCGLIANRAIVQAGTTGRRRLASIELLNDSLDEL
ncbi:MurR/RpiR family transcriptional regulator [Paracoccus aestuariivivens]|uniref:SIS domain-containing protein n=1 Tax=Paracoccus aestuariivivens TaxID=1820333 RepID=A0A6L6J8H7_9RHOB|nr:MurR/RpiR family transcriptional regulator [Paracoccus aestuariivivens]MTH78382.1 SIS domain-containing protein [Paracoccus aestuariivivens]